MKALFRTLHRRLSLLVAAIWLLQALSGIFLVFQRPLDDLWLGASGQPTKPAAVAQAIARIESRPDDRVLQYFVSGGLRGQVDLLVANPSGLDVIRIDGATGAVLRRSAWTGRPWRMSPGRLVFLWHKEFLAGGRGEVLMALSGVLLTTNLLMGLRLAWPGAGKWRASLAPSKAKTPAAAVFGWHRALGLWLVPLGLLSASTGALLSVSPAIERVAGALPPPEVCSRKGPVPPGIGTVQAEAIARKVFPDGAIAVVTLPGAGSGCFLVQMRRPGEWRRVFGTTLVYVEAATGAVAGRQDALAAPASLKAVEALYPVHDWEWGGWPTRLVALAVGLWLVTLAALGLSLWWTRRRLRRSARPKI